MKIIDKINDVYEQGGTTVSFEFFPAKTEAGIFNLLNRVEDMGYTLQPTFVTLTWRSAFKDEKLWLKIGSHIQNEFKMDVLLHLTCHLPKEKLREVLWNARKAGIQNILALRGDPPIGVEEWQPVKDGFKNAVELIKLIREEHGDYFCVACAGYAEVHTESWNNPDLPPSEQARELDLVRLKEKVDAGADLIISQFFFDTENTLEWMKRCRDVGIEVPILPGYLPIQNYNSFKKFTGWCKTAVPIEVAKNLERIRNDDQAVKEYGIELAIDTNRKILQSGCKSLHFYTMNLATTVTKVLQGLDLIPKSHERDLPWKSIERMNGHDEVRPIFWSNRQASYISRTAGWDDFPNGRWGDRRSPAFGELSEYYLAFKRPKVDRKILWGQPTSEQDVWNVFAGFIDGTVRQLPWCEQGLSGESNLISENLRMINSMGFLTINSQPKANAVSSSDPELGWGGEGGYVFQKSYVEFFTTPELLKNLLSDLQQFPNLSYHAVNVHGQEYSNTPEGSVNAVTWGIFPGKEVIQPTVVDSASFMAWKDEAFELWMAQWGSAYEKDSQSYKVIEKIYDTYFLVNIVENDYSSESDVFTIFKQVIAEGMDQQQLYDRVMQLEEKNEKLGETIAKFQSLQVQNCNEIKQAHTELASVREENSALKTKIRDLQAQLAMRQLS